jgi:multidrug efflux pump subunit AcrB
VRDFSSIALKTRNGAQVKLSDVAEVIASVENVQQSAWVAGHQAVMIDIHKQVGFNINATVAKIKDVLPSLQRNLPPTVHLVILGDRTQTIRSSVKDVQFTLLMSCILVVFVVYIFVGSLRATIIPAIVIPLSLFGTMAAMFVFGYTLDNVSLMALTISIGFVVDDAIVMQENILRHVEAGMDSQAAALKGSGEIDFTILSMTISLIAVFIPVLFMGGIVGRLFREFADTAAIAILISGVVSLTLTPVLCAKFLKLETAHPSNWFRMKCEAWIERVREGYASSLRKVLRYQPLMLAVMLCTLVITVGLYIYIPKGFFPQQDNGLISGVAEATPDISYSAMVRQMQMLADLVRRDDDIQNVYFWVEGNPSTNMGRISIDLKPFENRKSSVYEVIKRINQRAKGIPEITLHLQARQDLQVGARTSKTQFQYTLRDANLEELRLWTPRMLVALRSIPQIRDVTTDTELPAPVCKSFWIKSRWLGSA